MSKIESLLKQICFCLILSISLGLVIFGSSVSAEVHQCNHGHGHNHDHQGHHHHHGLSEVKQRKLPEELAEEEDLKLLGFGSHDDVDVHHHHNGHGAKDLTGLGIYYIHVSIAYLCHFHLYLEFSSMAQPEIHTRIT